MNLMFRTLILIAALTCATQSLAEPGWKKLSRENCAGILAHLRSNPLTIDVILKEMHAESRELLKDCGPGCWEYEDWSARSIPAHQSENEHKIASAYAESLLIKNEGLFLFSRYNGFDVPAWDGLTFDLYSGVVTSKISLKRGVTSRDLLKQAFEKAHRYSIHGGAWSQLPFNMATRYPPRDMTFEQAKAHATENYGRIGRWMLVDDERIRTRIIFQQPEHQPINEGLQTLAKNLLREQAAHEVESVTIINGGVFTIHEDAR